MNLRFMFCLISLISLGNTYQILQTATIFLVGMGNLVLNRLFKMGDVNCNQTALH